MSSAPITVIILTFNEEANIAAAIDSVAGWAKEIFVVDSYSTDRTVDIALRHAADGLKVVQHEFKDFSEQWNWALGKLPISQPWVLKLDADERATDDFRREVSVRISDAQTREAAFIVHWRLIFMGKWLRWGGLYPNGNIRLWRHGSARFENRPVNEHLVVDGPIGVIKSPIDHHDLKGLSSWLDRHNRYSSMEAVSLIKGNVTGELEPRLLGRPDERRMWLRKLHRRLPCRHLIYFLYQYILRLGFLDGLAGFRLAFLRATFLYWIDLKIKECRSTGRPPEVIWSKRGGPHPQVVSSEIQKLVDSALPEAGQPGEG